MTFLLIGAISALVSTNSPQVAGTAAPPSVVAVQAADPNDPVERDYQQLLKEDDEAEQDIEGWARNAEAFAKAGAGDPKVTLDLRIQQRLAAVRKAYDDFLQHHPNHVKALLAYGSFLNETHDENGALAKWEKARDLDPKNPAAWNNLGNIYGERGPAAKAFECYSKAIELNPNVSVYYHNLAVTLYLFRTEAREYYKMTEVEVFDKSLELYRKAIKLDPNNFILATDYAEAFYGTKPPRWKDGLAAWQDALKLAKDETEREGVYTHLARINIRLGNFDQTRRLLDMVTNPIYLNLKNTLTRNLNTAILDSQTKPPAK